MVDVTHDGHHRRTRLQVLRGFAVDAEELRPRGQLDLGSLAFADNLLGDRRVHRHRAGLDAKAVGDDSGRIEVDLLVDVRHDAVLHQLFDDVDRLDVQVLRQLLYGEGGRELDLAFGNRPLGLRGLAAGRELGAHGRLLLGCEHGHRMAGRMPRRAQEVEDLPGLDAEVTGELLNFDSAGSGGYG